MKLSLTDVYIVSQNTAADIINQITSERNLELQKIREQEYRIGLSSEWTELGFRSIGLTGDQQADRARAEIERTQEEFKKKEDSALNLAKKAVSVKFTEIARTTADVDGKFSFARQDPTHCLFAVTARQTGNKTEYYCWLIKLQRGSAGLMLTNKNMIDSTSPENFATSLPEKISLPADMLRHPGTLDQKPWSAAPR